MGMMNQGGAGAETDPQRKAASKITAGSKPSLLNMQDAMGGLMTSDGMKEAAGGLLDSVKSDFGSLFNDVGSFATSVFGSNPAAAAFSEATGQPVQQPQQMIPEGGIIQPPPEPVSPPPVEPPPPVAPTAGNGWGGVKTDADAIAWAMRKGDITPQEAAWLNRWQGEANDGDSNWADGSTRNWDYMNSGLTNQNKGIVDKFYKSISGNWGDAPSRSAAPQQPTSLPRGLFDMNPQQIAAAKNYARGTQR